MRKRIFLALITATVALFMLAAYASAVELITSTSDEFGTVNIIEGVNEGYTLNDKTSRVVLLNADGTYSTFPAYYVSDKKLQWQGTVQYKFDFLNAALGLTDTEDAYTMDSIVRVEVLTDSTLVNSNGGEYKNRANLKEVVFPEGTQVESFSMQLFKGAAIEKICIPASITSIGQNLFESCTSLKEVTFEEGFTMTTLPGGMFNGCTSLEKVIFPNSVTGSSGSLFNNCSSLKELRFGANFTTYPAGGMSVSNTVAIYAPATFLSNITTISKSTFASYQSHYAKTATLFLTGDEDVAKALVAKATLDSFKNATLIEYDSSKPDSYYIPENPTTWTIIYNYNTCKAFYEGEHKDPVEVNKFEGTEYLSAYKTYEGCDRCNQLTEKSTVCEAIFIYKGFSTNGESIFYDVKINQAAMAAYSSTSGKTFKYGIVVSQLVNEGNLLGENEEVLAENVLAMKFTGTEYSSLQVKIFNIADSLKTMQIHCCAYLIDDTGVKYLYDEENAEGESVPNLYELANAISYTQISGEE